MYDRLSLSTMGLISKRLGLIALALLVLFLLSILYARHIYAPSDDTFIFLVYARNFLEGNGFTFNGIAVEGYSSTLWLLMITALGILGVDLLTTALALSILSGGIALISTYYLARKLSLNPIWSLLPVALLAATGDFTFYMSVGLEQVMFVALVAVSTATAIQDPEEVLRSFLFPILLTLMILIRLEGALVAALLLVSLGIRSNSWSLVVRCGFYVALILAPFVLFRFISYGHWLPNTFFAKSNAGISHISQGINYIRGSVFRYGILLLIGSYLFARIFTSENRFKRRFEKPFLLLIISAIWLCYVIVQGGDNMVGGRVLIPILPLVYVALADIAYRTWVSTKTAVLVTGIACIGLAAGYLMDTRVGRHAEGWRRATSQRTGIGLYLRNNFPKDTLIALNPAGIIPYYSQLPTLDMLGLNDEYIAHHGKRDRTLPFGHQAGDGAYILSRKPDIIFFGSGSKEPGSYISDREIWSSDYFWQNYTLTEFPNAGFAYVNNDS